MNAKADENLASAEVTAAQAETAVEKMAVMTDFMKKTAKYCRKLFGLSGTLSQCILSGSK